MDGKEKEYIEIFFSEAISSFEELNLLLTKLEKDTSNKRIIDSIFRITHTLKGNAAGMGFDAIASLAHCTEDFFGEVRSGNITVDLEDFTVLFKAMDALLALTQALKTSKKVAFKGIKTRLEVLLKNKLNETSYSGEKKQIVKKAKNTPTVPQKEKIPQSVMEEVMVLKKGAVEDEILKGEEVITKLNSDVVVKEQEEGDNNNDEIVFSDLVQVPVRKLDNLLNLVGELIIERDRLSANTVDTRKNEYSRLHRLTSDLQYSVMDVRLVQVGFLFNKFHRVVRDTASIQNKRVNLKLEGTETEIDRNILQSISDSLIHIIRNGIAHGVESPEVRKTAGKEEVGIITLEARSESDVVNIIISDDGAGIDPHRIKEKAIKTGLLTEELAKLKSEDDIIQYIFEPGFSSEEEVNEVSGRGVGMDVVKKATEAIGGTVSVSTELGKGTVIILSLPSSMAVKGSLLFELNDAEYAIPLVYTESVVSLTSKDVFRVGKGLVASHLNETIPLVFLRDFFKTINPDECFDDLQYSMKNSDTNKKIPVVIISYNSKKLGVVVDKLLQQKEIVEKPLQKPLDEISSISGVTILGKGNVCPVLNVPSIINQVFKLSVSKSGEYAAA